MDVHEESPEISLSELLAHRDWVRAVARSLASEEADAADIEQETWVAALRRPPSRRKSISGWFSVVARNAARKLHRSRTRRSHHELRTDTQVVAESASDLAAHADAHRRVVETVVRLDEPLRETVLLRFFEGLALQEVADRMEVPYETVRKRLRKAMDVLRHRLGSEQRSRHSSLAVLLTAVLQSPRSSWVGAGLAAGGLMMSLKAKCVTVAVVLALLLSWQYTESRLAETPPSPGTDGEKPIEASRAPLAIEGEDPGTAPPLASPGQWAITLRGIVVDEKYSPVGSDVKVVVRRDALSGVLGETTTDGDGRFELDLRVPAGPGVLELEARDGARHGTGLNPCNYFREGPCEWLVLRLLTMVDVVGRVLDSNGTPVGSRRVLLSSRGTEQTVASPGYQALSRDYLAFTTTDERGEFRATLRAGAEGRFAVLNAGGAPDAPRTFAFANDGDTDLGDLVISEDAFCTWRLRFVDSRDVAVPGAMVQLYQDSQWTKALHPQLDHETWTIPADSHGELTLQLPCDLGMVESAVGSPRHQSLSLALDCRTPGEQEATVRLKDRRRIRVHVRGVDLAELMGMGLTVRAVPDRETKGRASDPRSLDVITGEEVDLPWNYPDCSRPGDGLEFTCSKWEPEATGDGFLVYVGAHGKYELRLRLPQSILARRTVVVGESDEEVAVELTLPPGRAVRLDCRELNAVVRAHPGAWLPRYAAWAGSAASGGRVSEMPVFLTPGAADVNLAGQDDRYLWVSLERPVVTFGLVEEAGSDGIEVFEIMRVEEIDLSQARPSLAVPVPDSRMEAFVPVTIAVTWRGRPFHTAGIPMSVARLDADVPEGEGGLLSRAFVSTDESGTATLRLFPGCYGCMIEPGVRMFPPGNPGSGRYRKRFEVIGSLAPTIQLEIGP